MDAKKNFLRSLQIVLEHIPDDKKAMSGIACSSRKRVMSGNKGAIILSVKKMPASVFKHSLWATLTKNRSKDTV